MSAEELIISGKVDCRWRNLWREPLNRSPKEQASKEVKLSGKRTEE
ncbi:hypothetical protein VINI7043_21691 [Vibrio nigripulchritudo ATCC 27043]|nr:hypothetical protein VINI7043_21691 [Vibrio nigripulchritudo ATCC 27043]